MTPFLLLSGRGKGRRPGRRSCGSGRNPAFLPDSVISLSFICAVHLFQLNMVITSILILCFIAMVLYQIIQALEHYYKKKCQ